MWILGKSLKKKYQLKEDVRESLYDDVNFWMKSLRAKGTPFMGGDQPGNDLDTLCKSHEI
jgi:microsomal prostaglandin-E synthase 2